jgi:hypothetical protein
MTLLCHSEAIYRRGNPQPLAHKKAHPVERSFLYCFIAGGETSIICAENHRKNRIISLFSI